MAALLSVADALARVLDGVKPLPREDAALTEADGRVLAADVASRPPISLRWTVTPCAPPTLQACR
jgi:molybdopterin biosynthesis enzyme